MLTLTLFRRPVQGTQGQDAARGDSWVLSLYLTSGSSEVQGWGAVADGVSYVTAGGNSDVLGDILQLFAVCKSLLLEGAQG